MLYEEVLPAGRRAVSEGRKEVLGGANKCLNDDAEAKPPIKPLSWIREIAGAARPFDLFKALLFSAVYLHAASR